MGNSLFVLCNGEIENQNQRELILEQEVPMKKFKIVMLLICCMVALSACGSGTETDYAAAIMVDDQIYYKSVQAVPAEIDDSAILGYTKYYTDTFPKKNGETNFNRELGMAYAKVEDGIAVLFENEWYMCYPKDAYKKETVIKFYEKPTKEGKEPEVAATIELTDEHIQKVKNILKGAKEWDDDYTVDREAYYFNGEIIFPDSEHIYYFTDEYNLIYYDHWFTEIHSEDTWALRMRMWQALSNLESLMVFLQSLVQIMYLLRVKWMNGWKIESGNGSANV